MIQTKEHIYDPVDFLQAYPEIVNCPAIPALVISGMDKDVLVTPVDPLLFARAPHREEWCSNEVLGNLYMAGSAYSVEITGKIFNLSWFPSPTYVNDLAARLGLTPGVDVLKFVHSPGYGTIPSARYILHLANGEFPQSTQDELFHHDRTNDHAPGVLLAPPGMTKNIIEFASRCIGLQRAHYYGPSKLLVRKVDKSTASLTNITEEMLGNVNGVGAEAKIEELSWRFGWNIYKKLFKNEVSGLIHPHQYKQVIARIVFEHLFEIYPAIEKLQQEVTAVPTRAKQPASL